MNSTDTGIKDDPSRQEEFAFLFAQLVLQQSNMAMMLLGKLAHPESGKIVQDVEAARLFIDQVEMLEAKTKGNLSKEEESLLKQTLMTLRLNYVQTVEAPGSSEKPQSKPEASSEQTQTQRPVEASSQPDASGSAASEDEEHRKKFSKKY